MKMDLVNKSNKVKHYKTIEKKKINGQNIKGEKVCLIYKQMQKILVKVVQIMEKSIMLVIQMNI